MKKKITFILAILFAGCIAGVVAWIFHSKRLKENIVQVRPAVKSAMPDLATDKIPSQNSEKIPPKKIISQNTLHLNETPHASVPDELSHLRLIGTAFNTASRPYAIIKNTRSNTQDLYKQGDMVENATIIQISSDTALLDFHGKTFKLSLEKLEAANNQLPEEEPLKKEPPRAFIYTTQQDVENAWAETQNLMTMIEFDQFMDNGEPKGVAVGRVWPDSVFEKIGFQPGDILKKVDDMEINIADDAMEVYNCIRTKPSVRFTVLRKGESEPVILEYNSQMLQK